jgi:hypothetical protein
MENVAELRAKATWCLRQLTITVQAEERRKLTKRMVELWDRADRLARERQAEPAQTCP